MAIPPRPSVAGLQQLRAHLFVESLYQLLGHHLAARLPMLIGDRPSPDVDTSRIQDLASFDRLQVR
jgi:hypothetical protein